MLRETGQESSNINYLDTFQSIYFKYVFVCLFVFSRTSKIRILSFEKDVQTVSMVFRIHMFPNCETDAIVANHNKRSQITT